MNSASTLLERFRARAGLGADCEILEVVRAVQALPYGRAPDRTGSSALSAGRGTCSTKHYLLAELVAEGWPEIGVEVVHRVYLLTPEDARRRFGEQVAVMMSPEGLVDVHTFVRIDTGNGAVIVDATFPDGPSWDGRSSMTLPCGPGVDYPGGADPETVKANLVAEHCDPAVREPFLAVLAAAARSTRMVDNS